MTKTTKGADHKEWLDNLRTQTREEAAKLISQRYPSMPAEEVQRRLKFRDAPPAPSIKADTTPPTKRVRKARNALIRAIARARTSSAQQQISLAPASLDASEGVSTGGLVFPRGQR